MRSIVLLERRVLAAMAVMDMFGLSLICRITAISFSERSADNDVPKTSF